MGVEVSGALVIIASNRRLMAVKGVIDVACCHTSEHSAPKIEGPQRDFDTPKPHHGTFPKKLKVAAG
jgi:hypothetical protein